ncbi:hypothetical protein C8R44DRAFT_991606, partial [Mycena epipterygia]
MLSFRRHLALPSFHRWCLPSSLPLPHHPFLRLTSRHHSPLLGSALATIILAGTYLTSRTPCLPCRGRILTTLGLPLSRGCQTSNFWASPSTTSSTAPFLPPPKLISNFLPTIAWHFPPPKCPPGSKIFSAWQTLCRIPTPLLMTSTTGQSLLRPNFPDYPLLRHHLLSRTFMRRRPSHQFLPRQEGKGRKSTRPIFYQRDTLVLDAHVPPTTKSVPLRARKRLLDF